MAPSIRYRFLSYIVARPSIAVTLFVLVTTTILIFVLPRPLSSDISGQLWIANQLRHGAQLYSDISEINPPLWFWMALPVDALAEKSGVSTTTLLIAAVGCATLTSMLATDRLLQIQSAPARTALLLYTSGLCLLMPLRDLGQREQIALIAALPYVALVVARREAKTVPHWLALGIGFGAALGFALKHYFVGVPLLLEIWLIIGLRRDWRLLRPETLALTAAAVGYVTAILLITPAYLTVSVPELMLAYKATGVSSMTALFRPAQPIWLLILCAILVERRMVRRAIPAFAAALLVATAGFAIAWLVQRKGWPYHSIATTGTLALSLAAMLTHTARSEREFPRPIALAALIAAMLLFVAPTQWVPTPDTDIAPALSDLSSGDTVALIAKEGRTAWPATVDRGLRFVGRRGSYWILAAIDANNQHDHDPRIEALGRTMVREAANDFRCLPPRRIIFTPRQTSPDQGGASANPLAFFRREPGFRQLLMHYRRLDRPGNFDAFERVSQVEPDPAARCPVRY